VVSPPEIQFCASPPVEDPENIAHGHPGLMLANEPIFVDTMPILADTLKTVIDEMTL
jgi:hypothetical protein